MNAKKLEKAFHRRFFSRYDIMVTNAFVAYNSEMGICAIRHSGYCDEVEIKLTVSDFKADFQKKYRSWNKH